MMLIKFLLEIEYKMNEILSNPPSFILPNAIRSFKTDSLD